MSRVYVINSRGEKEPISFRKIYKSARRVGAPPSLAKRIAQIIQEEVHPGIKTTDIFRKVKELLYEQLPGAALRFNLKRGMRKLGPTGFPFEKYIGEILLKNNFKIQLNQFIPGHCTDYEIDFLAKIKNILYIGECKYHNLAGGRVELKEALANYARFLDIKNSPFLKRKKFKNLKLKSLLVTNTKFTSRTIQYSKCVGVELLGWRYPKNRSLEFLIDKQKLYPVTILPSLKPYLADIFVSKKMMLIQDILDIDHRKFSKKFKVPVKHLESLTEEARLLLEA